MLAGQKLGIKEVDEGIWLVNFMHYDLGYFVTYVSGSDNSILAEGVSARK